MATIKNVRVGISVDGVAQSSQWFQELTEEQYEELENLLENFAIDLTME